MRLFRLAAVFCCAVVLTPACKSDRSTAGADAASAAPVPAAAPAKPEPEEPPTPPPPHYHVVPGTLELLAAAGTTAPLVLVVRAQSWLRFAATARRLAGALLSELPELEALLAFPDLPSALLHAVTMSLGLPPPEGGLPGWDSSRPLVVALADPGPLSGSVGEVAELWANYRQGHPGLRYRMIIPATDPAALAGALGTMAAAGGGFGTVVAGDGLVTVELVVGEVRTGESGQRAAQDRAEAPREPLRLTPALHHAASGNAFVSAYVRPQRLRSVAALVGVQQSNSALAHASPDNLVPLRARALALTAFALAFMSPEGLLADDIGLRLDVADSLRLSAVATLTPAALEAWKAVAASPGRPFKPVFSAAPAHGFVALDAGALLEDVPLPLGLAAAEELEFAYAFEELVNGFGRCGAFCLLHVLSGGWPPYARVLLQVAAAEGKMPPETVLPSTLSFALLDLDPEGGPHTLKAGVAAEVAAGYDTHLPRGVLTWLEREFGVRAELAVADRNGRLALLAGVNTGPRSAFEATPAHGPTGLVAELTLDTERLATLLGSYSPEAGAVLDKLAGAGARVRVSGRALVAELEVSLRGAAAPDDARPDYAGFPERDGAASATVPSPGEECLEQALPALARGMDGIATGVRSDRSPDLRQLDENLGPLLQCAAADPATREDAARLEKALNMFRAELDEEREAAAKEAAKKEAAKKESPADKAAAEADSGGLTRDQIGEVIKVRSGSLRYCYEQNLKISPNLSGKVVVSLVIASDGLVSDAKIESSTLGNKSVESCIVKMFTKMRFPASSKETKVSYPLVFQPGR